MQVKFENNSILAIAWLAYTTKGVLTVVIDLNAYVA